MYILITDISGMAEVKEVSVIPRKGDLIDSNSGKKKEVVFVLLYPTNKTKEELIEGGIQPHVVMRLEAIITTMRSE